MNIALMIGLPLFVAGVTAVVSARKIMNYEYATEAIGWARLGEDSQRIDRLMYFGIPAILLTVWAPLTVVVEVYLFLFG